MIEQASLVLGNGNWAVKSDSLLGYKTIDGKYYPREMTFTRATTGTRVNEAGLVELVPYNLLLNTNTFSSWNLEGGTLTSGFTAPDGSSTAYKYVPSSGGLWAVLNLPVMSAGTGATQSIWVKSVSGSNVTFKLGSGYSTQGISNKTATSQWQLFTNSFAFSDGGSMYIDTISDAQGIYVWHPQLVEGTEPLDYLPTTDRLDIARIDYSTGSPSLLLEPQRTNLCTYSQDFSNAAWNTSSDSGCSLTITPNYTTASNGLPAARLVASRTNTSTLAILVNYTPNTGINATKSLWMKNNNSGNVTIMFGDEAVTITDTWERYSVTNTYFYSIVGLRYSGVALNCDISITGSQFEVGAYPTSYIPTTSASVTRNADQCVKTGASAFIGQTEGTIFLNMNNLAIDSDWLTLNPISGSPYTNSIGIGYYATAVRLQIYSPSGTAFGTIASISGNNKIALGYKSGDIAMYINGVNVFSSSNAFSFNVLLDSITVASQSWLAGSIAANKIYSHSLYTTRLTNSELAQLTTP